ncbi:DUF1326 domain-containing protein [Aquibium microcysteis]|uniref:DUF1326 domain-containing protein n=1 Tax=Aquibium microcysteis TaxID=675281 RepID=UPI00165D1245|nr:DUF1326 domain-containing protein [Aquibium microcysteis]
MAAQSWTLKGEIVLSCSCDVFCAGILSFGDQASCESACQKWAALRVDTGHFGDVDLSGLQAGFVIDSPGPMSRGNWTTALFVDRRASIYAFKAFQKIFTGRAGGTTGMLSYLVGRFLGVDRTRMVWETEGETRIVRIGDIIDGAITPVTGRDGVNGVVIANVDYWVGSDVTVARADRSRMRAFGRDWNFDGRSAEICKLDWRGP